MAIKRLRVLAIKVFENINDINPSSMKKILILKDLILKVNPKIRLIDNLVIHHKTASYVDKSLATLSRQIWNKLLSNIKAGTLLTKFKE